MRKLRQLLRVRHHAAPDPHGIVTDTYYCSDDELFRVVSVYGGQALMENCSGDRLFACSCDELTERLWAL